MTLFDFLDVFEDDPLYDEILEEYQKYGRYVGLGVSCFCMFCFLLVFPLFFVQVQNTLKKTTTYERFAHNQKKSSRKMRSSELSDTSTMLLQNHVSSDLSLESSDLSSSQITDTQVSVKKKCLC